jgi:hypothetical protein
MRIPRQNGACIHAVGAASFVEFRCTSPSSSNLLAFGTEWNLAGVWDNLSHVIWVRSCLDVDLDLAPPCTETAFITLEILHAKSDSSAISALRSETYGLAMWTSASARACLRLTGTMLGDSIPMALVFDGRRAHAEAS